jgi:hypothetical protein
MKKLFLLLFLVTPWLLSAQDFQYNTNFVTARIDRGKQLPSNLTFSSWQLNWVPQGTLTQCSVQIETSPDGVTWTAFTGPNGCTIAGPVGGKGSVLPAYVRLNVTALQGDSTSNHNVGINFNFYAWSGPY